LNRDAAAHRRGRVGDERTRAAERATAQAAATRHRHISATAQRAAASMEGNPLRFLRLDRRVDDPQKIVATTFGQEEMQTAINSNLEMR
jgi:hypothetical protein